MSRILNELTRRGATTVDPLDLLPYPQHAGQESAWDSLAKFVLVLAGAQAGKTTWAPAWLYREIRERGPGDYLAGSASYDLFKLAMLPAMRGYFQAGLGWTFAASDRVMLSPDGKTRIILRSAEARGGLESSTIKAAWLDEWGQNTVTVEAWEAVQRRLAVHQGRAIITTTPYNLGWLKQQVYDRWVGGDPDYEVVTFRSCDNPVFPLEEYERAKRTLPDWRFQMFYNGEFTRPAGLIYGDYEDTYREQGGHLVKPFSIPPHWLRDVGVDFGGSVNNAQIWVAEDPAARDLYIYREVCGIDNTGPEQARAALEYNEPIRFAAGGAPGEDDQRISWSMAGFDVAEPLVSDVEAGIDRVIGLFKTRRLFVFDTLCGLRSELGTYSRELDDAGEPLARIRDKEKFHRADALRAVCSFYELDRPDPERHEEPAMDTRRDSDLQRLLRQMQPREQEDYF